jgi:hypothetical protein
MDFGEMIARVYDQRGRNRLRDHGWEESPIPGNHVQEIGVLVISPSLDKRLEEMSSKTGKPVGKLIAIGLDALERTWSKK